MASTFSSGSRERRRQEERDARLSAETEASVANVTAQLGTWASDRVGNFAASPRYPQASPRFQVGGSGGDGEVTWMKSVLERDDDDDQGLMYDASQTVRSPYVSRTPAISTPFPSAGYQPSTPASSTNNRGMERADTPVMSNSKRGGEEDEIGSTNLDRYSSLRKTNFQGTPSPNVHTPAPRSAVAQALSARQATTPRRTLASTQLSMEARQQVQTCQRYHDIMLQYLQSKRRWVERKELASSSNAIAGSGENSIKGQDPLIGEHARIQVDFLQGLTSLCYEDHSVSAKDGLSREGNFWNLMSHLRRMGMDALLWHGNATAQQMAQMEQLQQTFSRDTTPLQILEALKEHNQKLHPDEKTTSVIQRRYQLLAWLEDCFRQQLPYQLQSKENTRFSGVNQPHVDYKRNSELYQTQGLPETEKDAALLRQALAFILAGRLSQAQDLMRSNGLAWRAAIMGGGKPAGFSKEASLDGSKEPVPEGNPNRPLWQNMLWRQVEESTRNMTHEEKAIASLLCNNVKASFSNPCLRTWEKALFAGVKAMVGRIEDALFYQRGPAVNDKFARTHLKNTSDMAEMDEESLILTLASTPYPEMAMQDDDAFADATAAFMMGSVSVKALLQDLPKRLQSADSVTLRFLTHLVLYLDSTTVDSAGSQATALIQWDLNQIRDQVVVAYIQSLANRELWHLLVLYASMLPKEIMLHHLPPQLVMVTNMNDRATIVKQLKDLQSESDIEVLRAVVYQMEQNAQPGLLGDDGDMADETMNILDNPDHDDKMMKALLWFCIIDEHAPEALSHSNSLVRRFLLQRKLDTVFHFVEYVRPPNLIEKVLQKSEEEGDEEMPDQHKEEELEEVLSEFHAYESYIKAERMVIKWREVMEKAKAAPRSSQRLMTKSNISKWDEVERSIAVVEERRQLVEEKKDWAAQVIEAASSAQESLVAVLEHDGGWLWELGDNEDDTMDTGVESSNSGNGVLEFKNRQKSAECLALRKQILPHVVMLHCHLCQETAEWMASSLQQMVSHLAMSSSSNAEPLSSALALLDPSTSTPSSGAAGPSPKSLTPLSPTYWTTQAMEIADTLASDSYGIPVHEQILEQMAQLTVLHLQYCADLEQSPSL